MRPSILLFCVCLAVHLNAQITIDAIDFADEGDTVRMSQTTDNSIDFASTGSDYFWDFSGLVAESQKLVEYMDMSGASLLVNFTFGPFAPSKYQATYYLPTQDIPFDQISTFLPVSLEDFYQFSRKTNDSITSIGYGLKVDGNEIPVKSDTIETRYKFPMTYLQSYTSNGYTNLDMNPFYDAIWRQHRHRESIVDGWGTVLTPFGMFQALRIKHEITESDSLRMDLFGTPMWIPIPLPMTRIYEWWAADQKDAVMRITTSDLGGNEMVTAIEYRDAYLGIGSVDEKSLITLEVFPNPATDFLMVEGISSFTYQIFGSKAELMAEGISEGNIPVNFLSKGSYLLILRSSIGIVAKQFVKD